MQGSQIGHGHVGLAMAGVVQEAFQRLAQIAFRHRPGDTGKVVALRETVRPRGRQRTGRQGVVQRRHLQRGQLRCMRLRHGQRVGFALQIQQGQRLGLFDRLHSHRCRRSNRLGNRLCHRRSGGLSNRHGGSLNSRLSSRRGSRLGGRHGSGLVGECVATGRQQAGVQHTARRGLQLLAPAAEEVGAVLNQLEERRGAVLVLGQPVVHHLLEGPGGFAEGVQTHHAAGPLQRVEAAADRGHRLAVVRCLAHHAQVLVYGVQHLGSFQQEDLVQLGLIGRQLDSTVLQHALGQGRFSRLGCHVGLHAFRCRECQAFLGSRLRGSLSNRLRRQLERQRIPCPVMVLRCGHFSRTLCRRQTRSRRQASRCDGRLGSGFMRSIRGLFGPCRCLVGKRAKQCIGIGIRDDLFRRFGNGGVLEQHAALRIEAETAGTRCRLQHRLDKESHRTQSIGQAGAASIVERDAGTDDVVNLLADGTAGLGRIPILQDGQHGARLGQQRLHRLQTIHRRFIPEVIVQRLLAGGQVVLQFIDEGCLRHALGGLVRQRHQPRQRRGVEGIRIGQQTADAGSQLLRPVVIGRVGAQCARQRLFHEQHGGGHLDGQHLARPALLSGQRRRHGGQRLAQHAQTGIVRLGQRLVQMANGLDEGRLLGLRAARQFLPGAMHQHQRLAGDTDGLRISQAIAATLVVGRHQAGQMEVTLDLFHDSRAAAGLRQDDQQFLDELRRHIGLAGEQMAVLDVDATDRTTGGQIDLQRAVLEAVKQGIRQPVEEPCPHMRLIAQHAAHGLVQAIDGRHDVLAADQRRQRTLEAACGRFRPFFTVRRVGNHGAHRGRKRTIQVHVEERGRIGLDGLAQAHQVTVVRIQDQHRN